MNLEETLNEITAQLAKLAPSEPALKEMTVEQFLEYAKAEIEKARAEGDAAEPRLLHLRQNIAVAKAAYADSVGTALPVYSGPDSIQAQTAWMERSEKLVGLVLGKPSGSYAEKSQRDQILDALLKTLDEKPEDATVEETVEKQQTKPKGHWPLDLAAEPDASADFGSDPEV